MSCIYAKLMGERMLIFLREGSSVLIHTHKGYMAPGDFGEEHRETTKCARHSYNLTR